MELNLEDYIECIALVVISVSAIVTAFYVQKIYNVLKSKKSS